MNEIYTIDTITHELGASMIAREILEAFDSGHLAIQLVCLTSKVNTIPAAVRVSISQTYSARQVKKTLRVGLRFSEPFMYSFKDSRQGTFSAMVVRPYFSRTKNFFRQFETMDFKL